MVKQTVSYPYCAKYGFDEEKIQTRLSWLGLDKEDHITAKQLQEKVISPNVQAIIDGFYVYLDSIEEAKNLLQDEPTLKRLKNTQMHYLLNLGIHFDRKAFRPC